MNIMVAYEGDISGEIPVNRSNLDEILRFREDKRKNFSYFKGNMGISQFKRNFSGYFSNTFNFHLEQVQNVRSFACLSTM